MTSVSEILLVHHTHTDLGYTHDQPVVRDLQRRFLDRAVELAAADAHRDGPDAFRWTVEATTAVHAWLETAEEERRATFERLEAAGRIEVTGLPFNITPLYDPPQLVEALRRVRALRTEWDLSVRHAMLADVNGLNWPVADVLIDAGLECLSMAINTHYGGAPPRPTVFRWEAPSGRRLLAFNGFHYGLGRAIGVGHDLAALRTRWWPRLVDRLETTGYPLDTLMVQTYHPFGDNAPPDGSLPEFVRRWNRQDRVRDGELPRMRIGTPSAFWSRVRQRREDLRIRRGDWTDFWNFGAGSSARELAINRESRRRLKTADTLEAALAGFGAHIAERPPDRRSALDARDRAWSALHRFDEHTWGADDAVRRPHADDVRVQWTHKAGTAAAARSHSLMLRRDAIGELAATALDPMAATEDSDD